MRVLDAKNRQSIRAHGNGEIFFRRYKEMPNRFWAVLHYRLSFAAQNLPGPVQRPTSRQTAWDRSLQDAIFRALRTGTARSIMKPRIYLPRISGMRNPPLCRVAGTAVARVAVLALFRYVDHVIH